MQTIKKVINNYSVELTIKESAAWFEKERENVIKNLKSKANIKWFRKWSEIPDEVIIKQFWEDYIINETIDTLINSIYQKAIKKEWIIPVWPAKLKEIKSTSPFEVTLEIEILPEIEIDEKKLSKIKLKKDTIKVEKQEIEDTIKEIEKRFTTFEIAEWEIIESGDKATIDTVWLDKKWWKELEETKVKAFPLVIWSNSFIPWFEDKLIWSKVWDVVEFDIVFPKDYHSKDFAGRKVYFITTIFKLEKAKKPEWTEDFIEKLRWKRTDLKWFKEILEKEILEEKEYRARLQEESKLLEELEKICKIELWESLIKHESDRVYTEHQQNLESQWINIEHYLDHLKKDKETYIKETIEKEAIRRLKAELILEKLKEIIKVEINEDEINIEVEKIISKYESEEVKSRLKQKLVKWDMYYQDIENRLKYKKIIDSFFE